MNFMNVLEFLVLLAFLQLFLTLFDFSLVDSILIKGRVFKEFEKFCLIGVRTCVFKSVRMVLELIDDIGLLNFVLPFEFLEFYLIFEFKDVIGLILGEAAIIWVSDAHDEM